MAFYDQAFRDNDGNIAVIRLKNGERIGGFVRIHEERPHGFYLEPLQGGVEEPIPLTEIAAINFYEPTDVLDEGDDGQQTNDKEESETE